MSYQYFIRYYLFRTFVRMSLGKMQIINGSISLMMRLNMEMNHHQEQEDCMQIMNSNHLGNCKQKLRFLVYSKCHVLDLQSLYNQTLKLDPCSHTSFPKFRNIIGKIKFYSHYYIATLVSMRLSHMINSLRSLFYICNLIICKFLNIYLPFFIIIKFWK